jgi:hypothetical protein
MEDLDITEFRLTGLLQEVNRQFFHPIGLALYVHIDDEGVTKLGGIWKDDDPEGWVFGTDTDAEIALIQVNMQQVMKLQNEWHTRRRKALGYVIQPFEKIIAP